MDETRQYTVVLYHGLTEISRIEATTVFAASPEEAGELVLGEELTRYGKVEDITARVSFQGLSDVRVVLLYRKSES
jgi:hypothetical protein